MYCHYYCHYAYTVIAIAVVGIIAVSFPKHLRTSVGGSLAPCWLPGLPGQGFKTAPETA